MTKTQSAETASPPLLPGAASRTLRWPRALSALRHRNFRLFWFGQVISQIGNWMQLVAQSWLIYRLTDSPLMLGLVNVVGLLPVVPVSLLAGVISDRFERRTLIMITEIVLGLQAVVMGVLTWTGVIQVWHIIALSFVLGAAAALEQPARLAFVADVVGEEELTNAVALNASAYNSARIVGPAIAGLVLGWLGEASCFLINGLSYLPVVVALALIRLPSHSRRVPGAPGTGGLVAGFRYIWTTRLLRMLMVLVGVGSLLTLSYVTFMPVFADEVLQAGPQGLGWLMALVGVGAITGAMGVSSLRERRRGGWLLVANLLGPLFVVLFALSRSFELSLLLIFLTGAANGAQNTLANSLIQLNAQRTYHGRVMSVYNLLFNGMSRAGALGVGAMGQVVGVPWAIGVSAALSLIWAVFAIARMTYVRELA